LGEVELKAPLGRASLALAAVFSGAVPLAASCTVPALDLDAKKCSSASDCPNGETCTTEGACVPPPDGPAEVGSPDAPVPVNPCVVVPYFSG
jgi:hypothetical protein